jgi:small subunit ribosomal protein S3
VGQKTHPIGFRLGIIKDWDAKWFASKGTQYRKLLSEDMSIRNTITSTHTDAGISKVEIERGANEIITTIHTARPGIVIGRGGQRVDELRRVLEGKTGRRVRLNISEISQPEQDAYLVARNIADQLERRISYRRAIRQAVTRCMQAGIQGIKIIASGRLGGAEIARVEKAREGRVPLHTLRADIDYGLAEARTTMGVIGIKVWIYKGEILPKPKEVEAEELQPISVTISSAKAAEEAEAEAAAAAAALQAEAEAAGATVATKEAPAPAEAQVEAKPAAQVTKPEPVVEAQEEKADATTKEG